MTDGKFTYDEIILGLKCLADEDEIFCKDCAFRDMDHGFACKKNVSKASLDLINRQKEQIDTLKSMIEAAEDHYNPLPFKGIFDEKIAEARAEAIREFVESLKKKYENHIVCTWTVLNKEIDNLVKEMTEERQ